MDKQRKLEVQPARGLLENPWICVGLLLALVVVVFGKFLFSDSMLYGSDTMAGLDSRVLLRESLLRGWGIPMWLSSRLAGMPTIDAMFGDVFYPPTLLTLLVAPVHRALGLRLVLHVFLAGLFFFLLLYRGFRTTTLVALVGGAFYMFNTQFFSHIYPGHDGKMFVIALLPLAVWRLKALMENPRILNVAWLAAGIALCLFTSHIQMTYFMLWGFFLYWVVQMALVYQREKTTRALIVPALAFWGAVVLGIGIAAIQLYPSFMFVRDAHSVRGVERGFEYAASWSLHWPEVFSLWVPEFCGVNLHDVNTYWSENPFKLNSEYAGAMALLFAVFAIALKKKPWRIFWGAVAVLAVLYSLGAHTPVFHFAYALVPGVKKFRAGSMVMFWFSFGAVLLASLFFKDVVSGVFSRLTEVSRKRWQKGILIAMGCCAAAALLFSLQGFISGVMGALTPSLNDPRKAQMFAAAFSRFVPALWLWLFFALSALGLLWGVVAGKIKPQTFIIAVFVIGVVDLLRAGMPFVKTINARPYLGTIPDLSPLRQKMQNEPFRVFSLPGTLPQNGEGIQGLEGVDGFHDNELRWYREFRGDQQNRHFLGSLVGAGPGGQSYLIPESLRSGNAFLNLANVKYYLLRQGNQLRVLENEGALGRISFASGYIVSDSVGISRMLAVNGYDIRTTVALEREPEIRPALADSEAVGKEASVVWEKYTPNLRRAKVVVPHDGFLRISEVYYPGWMVRIDGTPVTVYRSDVSWMAVNISAGQHLIEMIPRSLYLGIGAVISLVSLAIGAMLVVVGSGVFNKRPGTGKPHGSTMDKQG